MSERLDWETALQLPLGKTSVMHLVPRENLPEPNSQERILSQPHGLDVNINDKKAKTGAVGAVVPVAPYYKPDQLGFVNELFGCSHITIIQNRDTLYT
ncbi:unnamed protein product [Oppiella nova]|uniref:Uncharacterized protein n=1 Tax=Oppiella nova TaxID=334625 RepID=A0A7R9QMG7_9ACAR|nr:unnamed protein product [Oppiella nova]CAG2167948.1 unnamed protein product [Oppiella nova]